MTADATLLARYSELDTTAVSDALDGLGLPPGQGGITPRWGRPRVVGFAATVELGPISDAPGGGAHILTGAVARAGEHDVVVVANEGRTDVSAWGGILSIGAAARRIRGVVVDGACRDVDQAAAAGFPVFARAEVPRTARGRLEQRSDGRPVRLGEATVHPGDVVLADGTGVVVVPGERAEEVLEAATRIARREAAIEAEVRAGVALPEAMRDARLAGTE